MKRFIVIFVLIAGALVFSGCTQNGYNPCGPGYYQVQTQGPNGQIQSQCVPTPPNTTNANGNPWLYYQWSVNTGHVYKTPANTNSYVTWPMAGQPGSDYWYPITVCTKYGKELMWIKGQLTVGSFNTMVGGSLNGPYTVEINYTTGPVPPYGYQGFIVNSFSEKTFWYGTACS